MGKPELIDPRALYHGDEFAPQKQKGKGPALQKEMTPRPDCGEESYVGAERLKDRRVLITGADSGIGRAVAIAFAREGADVAIHFYPGEEEDAAEVAEYVRAAGRKAVLIPGDFRDETVPDQVVEKVIAEFGGLDTLVLNVAHQVAQSDILTLPLQQVKDTFMVNIISMFALVKAAKPHLEPGSAIVTTTSVQAFDPSPNLMDYAATKAAIHNFTISLARQLIDAGIRVNGVAPGPIWTALQLNGGQLPGELAAFGQESPMKRAGQPVELAPVYVFLASNQASYVTGQIYGVTGGKKIN